MTAPAVRAGGAELVVDGVAKSFGAQSVLRDLFLTVPAGSLTAILGPSGSGKTTLLRVVAGFERADAGSVAIGGLVVDDGSSYVPPERRRVGYVPQEGGLFPHLSVARNVAFGLSRSERHKGRVERLLALVGMDGMAGRYPHQLSGGQQQRVALARALAVDPVLVLLDEPFSSLDAGLRASVRAEVRTVLRAAGATALLVTHDQDEALSWADQVAVLRKGHVGQLATPQQLYSRPADPDVAGFVGDANVLPGRARPGGAETALGTLAVAGDEVLAEGASLRVLVRPEQVQLRAADGEATVRGVVRACEYYGHDAVVRVDLVAAGGPGGVGSSTEPLVVRVMGTTTYVPGDLVGLGVQGPVLAWPADQAAPSPSA